jgi:hypothetical protein
VALRRFSGARDSRDPRDADEAARNFHLDKIAIGESVEIAAIDGNTFDAMPFAPGVNHKTPARGRPAHGKFTDDASYLHPRGRCIKGAVAQQQRGEKPGERNESVIDALQGFDFQVAQGAAF